MNDSLFRIVYYSVSRLRGSDAFLETEVRRILASARKNNTALGVSGALLFNRHAFVQVLEGAYANVERIFETIQRDMRHGDVTILQAQPIAERGFPFWSMAYVSRTEDEIGDLSAISDESGFDPSRLNGDRLFEMLQEMVADESRARVA